MINVSSSQSPITPTLLLPPRGTVSCSIDVNFGFLAEIPYCMEIPSSETQRIEKLFRKIRKYRSGFAKIMDAAAASLPDASPDYSCSGVSLYAFMEF